MFKTGHCEYQVLEYWKKLPFLVSKKRSLPCHREIPDAKVRYLQKTVGEDVFCK